MDLQASTLNNFSIVAKDGPIGTVADVLFDDVTWRLRWVVVETKRWLTNRSVLVHPTAIGAIDRNEKTLTVNLTKAQIEASPSVDTQIAMSPLTDSLLHNHYGSDPHWGNSYSGACWPPAQLIASPMAGGTHAGYTFERPRPVIREDTDLRSLQNVIGYRIHAVDGEIGHFEDVFVDDTDWSIRSLMVATRNWWPGKHVVVPASHVVSVRSSDREFRLDLARQGVKNSPLWDPSAMMARSLGRPHL